MPANNAEAAVNLADMISHQARRRPGHPAIVAGEDVVTYGALDPLVRGAAAWLADLGARAGDVIGLALADTADHLILHYAVARMGGIILPIDWRWTAGEKRRIAEFFGAALVLAEAPGEFANGIAIDASWRERMSAADTERDFPAEPDAPVVLSLSSGTTGRPKGPALSHRQLLARWITQFVTLTFSEHDRYLNAVPLYFGGGRSFSMSALHAGATVILFPPPHEPNALIEAAARHRATTTLLVPTQLRRLLAVAEPGGLAFPSLRLLLSTGAVLHEVEARSLERADLSGLDLGGADLSGTILARSVFRDSVLHGALLSYANLADADLRNVRLSEADLTATGFNGANLAGADLSGANARAASFFGANLSGANLSGANLVRCDFTGADLSGVDLSGATFDERTRWPEGFSPG